MSGREVGSGREGVSGREWEGRRKWEGRREWEGRKEWQGRREWEGRRDWEGKRNEGVSTLLYYAKLPNWFEVYCVKLVVSIPHTCPCTLQIKVLHLLVIIEDERIICAKFKRNQVKHLICLC